MPRLEIQCDAGWKRSKYKAAATIIGLNITVTSSGECESSSIAEFIAIELGVLEAIKHTHGIITEIHIYTDSRSASDLFAKTPKVFGNSRSSKKQMVEMIERIRSHAPEITIGVHHIPRKELRNVDKLANMRNKPTASKKGGGGYAKRLLTKTNSAWLMD